MGLEEPPRYARETEKTLRSVDNGDAEERANRCDDNGDEIILIAVRPFAWVRNRDWAATILSFYPPTDLPLPSVSRLQRIRIQRIQQKLAVDQDFAIPRQHDRAFGRERVEIGSERAGLKRDGGSDFGSAGVHHRRDGETDGVARVARFVDDQDATSADGRRCGAQYGRRLTHGVGAKSATDDNRVEFATENRGDDRAGNNAGGRNADHDLGVVLASHFQREAARELAEQRPFDFE
jgi:hypothetical protein